MRTISAVWSSWGPSPQLRTFTHALFFYIKEPMKSALKWIIQALKNFVLDSDIHCTRRPANHVFLSLGRGCVFLKISRGWILRSAPPRAIFSLWKFSKIHTPALFKFIPLTKYNHINHILLYQSTQFFFYIKEPIKSALKWIILAMKNFVLDSNIHCTRRPANHVFLSLGRGLNIQPLEIFKNTHPCTI